MNEDERRSLIIIPTGPDRELQSLSEARMYIEETRGFLRALSEDEKEYLNLLSLNRKYSIKTEEENPDHLAALEHLSSTLGAEFLSQTRSAVHLIFLLRTRGGVGAFANNYIGLMGVIKGQGGKASLIGADEIASAGVDLFAAVEADNRYIDAEMELMVHLSDRVSDPELIYEFKVEEGEDCSEEDEEAPRLSEEECRQEVRESRQLEIDELRTMFLPLLTGEHRERFERHLSQIPLDPPLPDGEVDDQPFELKGKHLISMGVAKETADPIQTLSDLTGIQPENIPREITDHLETFGHDSLKKIFRSK